MAGSVNKVILVGNLGADPEIRSLNSGDRVANLRVATSETWRDKSSGERKEKTEWHRVVIFNDNLVKVAEQYLRKGSKILSGRFDPDPQMGRPVGRREVLHRDRAAEVPRRADHAGRTGRQRECGRGRRLFRGGFSSGPRAQSSAPREDFSADLDDEIPF